MFFDASLIKKDKSIIIKKELENEEQQNNAIHSNRISVYSSYVDIP